MINNFSLLEGLEKIAHSSFYLTPSINQANFTLTTASKKCLTASDVALLILDQVNNFSYEELQASKKSLEQIRERIECKKDTSLWQKIKQIGFTRIDNFFKKRGMIDSLTIIQKVEKVVENRFKAVPQNHRLILSSLTEDHFVQIFSYIPEFWVFMQPSITYDLVLLGL